MQYNVNDNLTQFYSLRQGIYLNMHNVSSFLCSAASVSTYKTQLITCVIEACMHNIYLNLSNKFNSLFNIIKYKASEPSTHHTYKASTHHLCSI